MLPLEILAWGAVPVLGACLAAGVHRRMRAAADERMYAFRSFRATVESYHRQQNELVQRAMREARNVSQ